MKRRNISSPRVLRPDTSRRARLAVPLTEGVVLLCNWIGGMLLRRRFLSWGTTPAEQQAPLPGDELVPHPTHVTTRAISIEAPPDTIWSWLVQMGQDRAGFYTHNWVERLLQSGIPDVHEVHPEWQSLRVGDLMRTNRELQPGHPLGSTVEMVAPARVLVLRSKSLPAGTYAYILQPLPHGATRLLARDCAVWRWWQAPFRVLLFEPLHAYMQSGQLQGIKQRTERGNCSSVMPKTVTQQRRR